MASPTSPLVVVCHFSRDGREIGHLSLSGRFGGSGLIQTTERAGQVEVNGVRLRLRSEPRSGTRRIPTAGPVRYSVEPEGGERVGAIDTTGLTRARVAAAGDAAHRDPILAAAIALAVFWEPGDTDDD